MKKIDDIFNVEYPRTLVFSNMILNPNGINFVSSRGENNGVVAKVQRSLEFKEYPPNVITVPLKGTVLMAYLQVEPCYVAHQIAVLSAKKALTENQLLYYCLCIRQNQYRYNYGRQADNTLRRLMIPDVSEIPEWVNSMKMPQYNGMAKPLKKKNLALDITTWRPFRYDQLFDIKKGKRITKLDLMPGKTPFVSAIDSSNGIREYTGVVPLFKANTIAVNYNGNGVAEAFYHEQPYWASDDVNVLYPKFKLNKYVAMFLITVIRQDKYRFNYGRKWHKERMEESFLYLPVTLDGLPDWVYMEEYIKTLPFSASI